MTDQSSPPSERQISWLGCSVICILLPKNVDQLDLNRVYLDKCGFIIQFKPLVWKLVIGHIQYFLLRFIEEDGLNQNYNLAVLLLLM